MKGEVVEEEKRQIRWIFSSQKREAIQTHFLSHNPLHRLEGSGDVMMVTWNYLGSLKIRLFVNTTRIVSKELLIEAVKLFDPGTKTI